MSHPMPTPLVNETKTELVISINHDRTLGGRIHTYRSLGTSDWRISFKILEFWTDKVSLIALSDFVEISFIWPYYLTHRRTPHVTDKTNYLHKNSESVSVEPSDIVKKYTKGNMKNQIQVVKTFKFLHPQGHYDHLMVKIFTTGGWKTESIGHKKVSYVRLGDYSVEIIALHSDSGDVPQDWIEDLPKPEKKENSNKEKQKGGKKIPNDSKIKLKKGTIKTL